MLALITADIKVMTKMCITDRQFISKEFKMESKHLNRSIICPLIPEGITCHKLSEINVVVKFHLPISDYSFLFSTRERQSKA